MKLMEDRPVYQFKSVHVTDAPPIAGSFPLPHSKYTGRTTKKPRQLEHQLQSAMVLWFDLQYPALLLAAIPNGGQRDEIVGAKMKREGQRRGMPDLQLYVARGGYHGLMIEVKTETGTLSVYQRERIHQLELEGYLVAVVRSLDSFMQTVNDYLSGVLIVAHDE